MDDFVRVTLENGAEGTITRAVAERHKLKILDKPAVDARGYALADKPRVELQKAGSRYESMKPEELAEEATARGVTVEGNGANGNVLKADYVAALVAADADLT
jgi:hypothetical protein